MKHTTAILMVTLALGSSSEAAAGDLSLSKPASTTLGLGVGWEGSNFAASAAPSTGMLRLRLASGLGIEPALAFHRLSEGGRSLSDRSTLDVSTTLRIPLASRDKTELSATTRIGAASNLGGVDADENAWAATLSWGLGLEYFLNEHWSFGVDASSPLWSYAKYGEESSQSIGPVLAPRYSLLATLYY